MSWTTAPHWASVRLGSLGDWMGGRTPDRSNPAFWMNGTVPWISPKSMKNHFIDAGTEHVTVAAVEHGEATMVPAGSILIVVRSGILKHSVPVAVTNVACAINQDLRALLPADGVDAAFVAAQLRWRHKEVLHVARKAGVTVDSLDQGRLVELLIGLPPLAEQVSIGRRLTTLIAGVASARKAIGDAVRAVDATSAALADKVLASAEAECDAAPLASVLREPMRTGLSIAGNPEPPGVPALRLSALRTPTVDLRDVRYLPLPDDAVERHVLRDGDVLVARGSGTRSFVGRASLVRRPDGRTIFPDTAFRIRLDPKLVDPAWFVLVWNAPRMRARLTGTARTTAGIWKVATKDLLASTLPLRSLARQNFDIKTVEAALGRAARAVDRLERASRLLDMSEAAIYLRAFSGLLVNHDAGDAAALKESLMRRVPAAKKRVARQLVNVDKRLDDLLPNWPVEGRTFEELRGKIMAPYDDVKDALFRRLSQGALRQHYDEEKGVMLLVPGA